MMFNITILGSASAIPTKKRFPSAQLINMLGHLFLVDCGEGTQLQLIRSGTGLQKIERIFISHLHGDHFFGLPGLITSMHLTGRTEPLHVYADNELPGIIDPVINYSHKNLGFEIVFHALTPGKSELLFENDNLLIKSIPLLHGINTWGFIFEEKEKARNIDKGFVQKYDPDIDDIKAIKAGADFVDKKGEIHPNEIITRKPQPPRIYGYCSDTRYFDALADQIKYVTTLYHEASFMEADKILAEERNHSTSSQAADIARKTNCRKLILGHFSARYKTLDNLLDEAQQIFPNTYLAEDLCKFDVI